MKTKKEITELMIENTQEKIYTFELMEKYLSQKLVLSNSGKQPIELQLGQTQREIKENQELLGFLKRTLSQLE